MRARLLGAPSLLSKLAACFLTVAALIFNSSKLTRYTDLYHYTPTSRAQPASKPGWQARYPVFPDIICVLTGQPRATLQRRAQTILALCQADPHLQSTPEVRVSLALLEDLQGRGPFAPIWRRPNDPARPLDWLGRAEGHP